MAEEIAKEEAKRIDGQYIILPRPKELRIGQILELFNAFMIEEVEREDTVLLRPMAITDSDFYKAWNKFLNSLEK